MAEGEEELKSLLRKVKVEQILEIIRTEWRRDSICLDPTYTGKAFAGMLSYVKENNIKDKNILFIHTGGTPLFYDALELL